MGSGQKVAATLSSAKLDLAKVGVVLTVKDSEYRVNFRGGSELTAYYTNSLEDALGSGLDMARRKAESDLK